MKTLIVVSVATLFVAITSLDVKGPRELQHAANGTTTIDDSEKAQLEARVNKLETLVEDLQTRCQTGSKSADTIDRPQHHFRGVRQTEGFVGFTAYLDRVINHMGVGQTVLYDKIILNEGNAYNPLTGHFTCPVEGYYAFSFYVYTNNIHQFVGRLVVDGVNQLDGISDSYHQNQEVQGGNFLVVHLRVGQVVSIQNYRWTDKEIEGTSKDHMSSFSGYLISY